MVNVNYPTDLRMEGERDYVNYLLSTLPSCLRERFKRANMTLLQRCLSCFSLEGLMERANERFYSPSRNAGEGVVIG